MRVRSLASGLVVPVLLVGLVVLLATMQYRWLGQVSEAEREQLQRSLSQRAREFADDFDTEIARLYVALKSGGATSTMPGPEVVPARLDAWRANARFPALVRALYLAEPAGDGYTIRLYDDAARRFGDRLGVWPRSLEPVRARFAGSQATVLRTGDVGPDQFIAVSLQPLSPDIPAVLVPVGVAAGKFERTVPRAMPRTSVQGNSRATASAGSTGSTTGDVVMRDTLQWIQGPRSYLIVELDREVIRARLMPALAARHFPDQDATPLRLAVRTTAGDEVYARSLTKDKPIDPAGADASAPLFRLRPEILRGLPSPAMAIAATAPSAAAHAGTGLPPVPSTSPPPAEPRQFSIVVQQWAVNGRATGGDGGVAIRQALGADGAWQLLVQHAAGSLDVAVSQARRRNLALSFGILGILATGVMLVVVNARRTKQLAARQMDFVATVTHELRTPLAVIRSAAQNLSAGVVAEPAQSKTYGDLIDKEGRRLTDMVEQVLAYAGLEGGKAPRMTPRVDLSHIVNDVLDACQPLCAEAGIAIEFDADAAAGAPAVSGDEAGLRLVVQNLVANALKHGAEGRWIGVSVAGATHHGRAEACVTVSDRGRGIDPSELAHVFEPFYRGRRALDDQIRGNGLGLSLVKRIVEAHGGRVAAESSPGSGTTFTIHLPAAGAEPRA